MDETFFSINGNNLKSNHLDFNVEAIPPAVRAVLQKFSAPGEFFEVQTSGSTSVPKIIRISKSHMLASAKMTLSFLNLKAGDKALLCMSAGHIGGIMMIIRSMVGNLDLHITEPSVRPLHGVDENFDFAAMVPYQVAASLNQLHRIRKLIIGGGPLDPQLEKELGSFPNEIYHTYGMTETISHIAMRRINGDRDGSWFRAMEGVRFAKDHRNCLIVDAPDLNIFNLVTNDIVELKSEVSFRWKGRYDNVVNSAGIKLHPEEIERKIGDIGYPYFLAGRPDGKFGESLVMIIESRIDVNLNDLEKYFSFLGKYERPKQLIHVPEFAKTDSGKLSRKATLARINFRN